MMLLRLVWTDGAQSDSHDHDREGGMGRDGDLVARTLEGMR